MAGRRNWSDEEVRHALALYLVTPFGRLHARNPDILALAGRLGRSANAVALKLTNLAALDESLPQTGMTHASATDRRVWQAFLADPDEILSAYHAHAHHRDHEWQAPEAIPNEQLLHAGLEESPAAFIHGEGGERRTQAMQRIGQEFFRRMILTSYREQCALTGIEDRRLLNASHIVPWKEDTRIRLNPANGICLNSLHDRAFDRYLITFDEDYRMVIAPHVPAVARCKLEAVDSKRLEMPDRFLPDPAFLERHRRRFFEVIREER